VTERKRLSVRTQHAGAHALLDAGILGVLGKHAQQRLVDLARKDGRAIEGAAGACAQACSTDQGRIAHAVRHARSARCQVLGDMKRVAAGNGVDLRRRRMPAALGQGGHRLRR